MKKAGTCSGLIALLFFLLHVSCHILKGFDLEHTDPTSFISLFWGFLLGSWVGICEAELKTVGSGMVMFCVCADPFADANAEDSGAGSKDYVHVRVQQRNGRKSLTTVQGLKKEFNYNKILKDFKKVYHLLPCLRIYQGLLSIPLPVFWFAFVMCACYFSTLFVDLLDCNDLPCVFGHRQKSHLFFHCP